MKKSLSFFLLFVSICVCAQPAGHSPADLLAWNEFYHLRWDDFRGQPGEDAIGDAGTAVQIKAKPFRIKNVVRYDVVALFNRRKSWSRDQSPALLDHERLHFDIAELYARKIRKRIAQLHEAGVNDVKTYNAEIEELLTESNEVDYQYDIETLHGALSRQQAEWSQKVKTGLKKLEQYRKARYTVHS
ncbi:MAG TPA: DUF922 domain-containing protein [Chryseosolibacter sp.]